MTMGSCFAQHIARHLVGLGLNHFIVEPPPAAVAPDEARRRNYGIFSARYGNIYTVRQALQLFERAFGLFSPEDDVWEVEGGYVDAFRPTIEPQPFSSPDAVRKAAAAHLGLVRQMFTEADWLIFTLGLTEAWRASGDGAVYPTAPGVAAGTFDPARYEFANFTLDTMKRDFSRFLGAVRKLNPSLRFILTVSPVPLIATYENRHVLCSSTYSKAALRVLADEMERAHRGVIYFPSYEIITSNAAGNAYFEDDLRSVREVGVRHVLRVFRKHFVAPGRVEPETGRPLSSDGGTPTPSQPEAVICDEELIESSVASAGVDVWTHTKPREP